MVTSRLIFVRMAWNTKAIADAIKFYIENRDAIRKQGNNAFNVVQDFFPEKVFGDLKALYLEMFKLRMYNDIQVIIMAGGVGSRF